ncbi:Hsp70 family protein [Chondromyces apiculatus]|uniref:Putative heat shock protein YegD n=1 Tax=Chondromyces apiculatus DSM 436 TaxID=1192034 RepID=A0A017T7E9_9BACT|nr:Hsp70 family protein [Chondromyces apiculatus]EYF04730.1 Putative heat shock protein YegD [Chondromyces apiculatus DSM 436]
MTAPFTPSIYAIDFGTSNSLLAAASADATCPPIPLDDDASDPTILRSVLFFDSENRFSCGARAISDFVAHGMQGRLIRSTKKYLPDRSFSGTQVGTRTLTIEELIGRFLRTMRERADRHFGVTVDRVLLGRPARFAGGPNEDALAEERLTRAAKIAGFREVSFCPEPVAAAHDVHLEEDRPSRILIADFGGGTSDFTVVRMHGHTLDPSGVLALGGVSIAGDALDGSLMRHKISHHFGADVTYRVPLGANVLTMPRPIVEKLCSPADMTTLQHRDVLNFLRDVKAWSLGGADRQRMDNLLCLVEDALAFRVFEAIERTKRELSDKATTTFRFDYPTVELHEEVTRGEFEAGAARAIDTIVQSLDQTVAASGVSFADIDMVCCTGGTARVPRIAAALEERFGPGKMHNLRSFHSVVQGLAERARQLAA